MKPLLAALLALVLAVPAVPLAAQSGAQVQQRMQDRLAAVDALKKREVVGENNRGFLEFRTPGSGSDQELVSAENADRALVYAEIAKKTGGTPEGVGRIRARRIAELSAPGIWLQNESGDWYKK